MSAAVITAEMVDAGADGYARYEFGVPLADLPDELREHARGAVRTVLMWVRGSRPWIQAADR